MHTLNLHNQTNTRKYSQKLSWFIAFVAAIACQVSWAAGSYTYNAAGDEVTDTATGLVWKRCSAGQTWGGGTCSGTAAFMTHEQALTHATGQAGWRLPNVKELASIVDGSRNSPAIDILAFPNTSTFFYWTSSPHAGSAVSAWGVSFSGGNVNLCSRTGCVNNGFVRLVR